MHYFSLYLKTMKDIVIYITVTCIYSKIIIIYQLLYFYNINDILIVENYITEQYYSINIQIFYSFSFRNINYSDINYPDLSNDSLVI